MIKACDQANTRLIIECIRLSDGVDQACHGTVCLVEVVEPSREDELVIQPAQTRRLCIVKQ